MGTWSVLLSNKQAKSFLLMALFLQMLSACNNSSTKDEDKYVNRLHFTVSDTNSIRYQYNTPLPLLIPDNDTVSMNLFTADSLAKPLLVGSILDTVNARYINLSNNGPVLGKIDKIIFTERYIFILDWKITHDIFQFDMDGHFIRTFKELTEGKLSMPVDFDIAGDTVYVIDQTARLWLTTQSGGLIKKYDLPLIPQGISFTGKNEINCYNNSPEYNKNILLQLRLPDSTITGSFLPIRKPFLSFEFSMFPFAAGIDRSTLFMPSFSDTVYRIKNNIVSPAFVMNTGKKGIPQELYKDETAFKAGYDKYRRHLNFNSFETSRYFATTLSDKLNLWVVLNKETGATIIYKSVGDDLLGGAVNGFPVGVKGDSLVMVLNKNILYTALQKENSAARGGLGKKIEAELKDAGEFGNPVLIISPWK